MSVDGGFVPVVEDVILPRGHHRITWACPEHPDAGATSVAQDRNQAFATATRYWDAHLRTFTHRRAV